mmetsp:Transcript_6540/g.15049  ORF Transcript_6540/g.15049 Transcript_6540/m.15049 type:complete len:493 (+) Transcript_6540:86-1564(+)|eukprot:CAMPEP_0206444826 /NCGR_PEP_ID=MMETSP0324_2-20121206/15134_1 /ASSEMBLY_ACC=CAM_ASM_000836 /TAXON_ID=2866 /ORGANISM="Crypthecodinium cohnii, Strain Seligo" /LENGTH=492 /DNA_ID=CAMNT_0053912905 /DNA_START=77 /DNA_END=1555 /DNA_ORIENTATION=-
MAAEGYGEGYADETGTRRSTLLGISPEQVQIKIPSLIKGPVIILVSCAVLVGASVVSFVKYPEMPDQLDHRLTSTNWRVTTEPSSNWYGWKLCALIPYSDDKCQNLIDLSGAEISAMPALPAGWTDYNSNAAAHGGTGTCANPWTSGFSSDPPYLDWKFPEPQKVGCFKAQYVGLIFWSNVLPTVIEAQQQDGTWVLQRSVKFGNHAEWDRISTFPEIYEGGAQDNPYKNAALAVGIVGAIVGAGLILFALPVTLYELYTQKEGRETLQNEVREGKAFLALSSESQWAAFVEEHWGPGGVVHREQTSWWMWVLGALLTSCIVTVLVKLKSMGKGHDLDWFWCAVIGAGLSCVGMFILWVATKVERRLRYNFLKRRGRQPAVLGTRSLYFAEEFVKGTDILASIMIRSSSVSKTQLVVVYKYGKDDKMKVAMPIAEHQVEDVKAFIRDNSSTYRWLPAVQRRVIAPSTPEPTAPPSSVMMVTPNNVQVVESST